MLPRSVLIVGAGPAGASAAVLLALAGWRVDVIEARAFPRVKVCGEFVSPAATDLLEALISPADLRAAGARQVRELTLERDRDERMWLMPRPAWALSRASLDTLLSQRAADAGARIHQPASVRSVEYHADQVTAHLADGRALSADLILHTDGHGRHDPAGPTPVRPGVLGLKCHLVLDVRGLRMRSPPGRGLATLGYVGLISVERGLATCALVASTNLVSKHAQDHDALLASLWPGYDPATRARAGDLGRWHACGVHDSAYVTPGHLRSFRLGNAAAAVEPVGGEGIGLALWSAHTLAALLAQDAPLAHTHRRFAAAYRRRLRTRRPACRLAAEVLSRPALAALAWPALAVPGLTVRPWYALTGKALAPTA